MSETASEVIESLQPLLPVVTGLLALPPMVAKSLTEFQRFREAALPGRIRRKGVRKSSHRGAASGAEIQRTEEFIEDAQILKKLSAQLYPSGLIWLGYGVAVVAYGLGLGCVIMVSRQAVGQEVSADWLFVGFTFLCVSGVMGLCTAMFAYRREMDRINVSILYLPDEPAYGPARTAERSSTRSKVLRKRFKHAWELGAKAWQNGDLTSAFRYLGGLADVWIVMNHLGVYVAPCAKGGMELPWQNVMPSPGASFDEYSGLPNALSESASSTGTVQLLGFYRFVTCDEEERTARVWLIDQQKTGTGGHPGATRRHAVHT